MADLAQYILDIGMNALSNDAECIKIEIAEKGRNNSTIEIAIVDDGQGLGAAAAADEDSDNKSARFGPRGLAGLHLTARDCNGTCRVQRMKDGGTRITASLDAEHSMCPPIGDLARTVMCLAAANPHGKVAIMHRINGRSYNFDTTDLRARLRKIGLHDPKDVMQIRAEMSQKELEIKSN